MDGASFAGYALRRINIYLDRKRIREYAKFRIRSFLYRRNLDLTANPYSRRLVTALKWLGIDTVIDIGANIGQYASLLRSCGFDGDIVSCEPLADAYAQLRRRSSADSKWESIHSAVGAKLGEAEIHVSANSYSSSLLPTTERLRTAYPGAVANTVERVEMTTVAALVTSRGLTPMRSLLKIDTQGFESEVLDGAGDILKQFGAIQVELSFVPLYDGQALHADLVERLDRLGFVLFTSETGISDPTTGQLLQYDALFVRRDLLDTDDGAGGASLV